MKRMPKLALAAAALAALVVVLPAGQAGADPAALAKIREEGFQRSQVVDLTSYMTDVLGARLTLSQDMKRAQAWAKGKMEQLGLANVAVEPFMDYGAAWDNEYFSLHLLEPDYTPMTGFPIAYTPGTNGKVVCPAVIADGQTKADLAKLTGRLKGAAVLISPLAAIDLAGMAQATPRRTAEELEALERIVLPAPPRAGGPPAPPNPEIVRPEDRIAFFKSEGAALVLQCNGNRPGLTTGFSRPGANNDRWARERDLASLPIVAVTPEHYNRMVRILRRGLPVKIEAEIRNRIGEATEQAANVLGEIPGTDLKDEVVMIGAHFDTWHASPNASDDTAGCAVALEAARILKAAGLVPRRTIRVALWGGEEQGLHGSREYVLKHFGSPRDPKHPPTPAYEKFCAYFNQDYGAGAFRGINLQGNEFARRVFAGWMAPLKDLGCTAVSVQSVGSTDHVSFDQAGLPGFQFIQDRIVGTAGHTNLDFFDTLQTEDLVKNAVIMAVFAYNAATADERIPRKTSR